MRFLATPPVGLLGLVLDEPLDDAHVHAVAPVERHHRELGPVRVVDHGLARGRRPRIVHLVGVRCFDQDHSVSAVSVRAETGQASRETRQRDSTATATTSKAGATYDEVAQPETQSRETARDDTTPRNSQRHQAESETARDTKLRETTARDTTPRDRQPETLRRETTQSRETTQIQDTTARDTNPRDATVQPPYLNHTRCHADRKQRAHRRVPRARQRRDRALRAVCAPRRRHQRHRAERQTAFDTTPRDRQPLTLRRETDSH
jgi:hypothetical protein